jgi:ferric enterobactin receptor
MRTKILLALALSLICTNIFAQRNDSIKVKALKEVVIVTQAPVVENKPDKIIYNVASDLTSQGGVATDVLKKVPQVSVDVDGNVELQGNPNIRFLINGKPSAIFGSSLADALASIPASQIKSIEVMTIPGAKYDAQGTGGIINIILKDNRLQGVNVSISIGAGTRLENTAVNLNVRKNNIGLNAFFAGNAQLKSATPYYQDRYSANTHLIQEGTTDFSRNGYQSGLGFDWNISKTASLTAGVAYNHFGNQTTGLIYQNDNTSRQSDSRNHTNSLDWNLGYKKKFKASTLDLLYSASSGNPYSTYSQTQFQKALPYVGNSSNNPGTDKQHNFSADYSHPFNNNVKIETGAKVILHALNNSADAQAYDPVLNNYSPDPAQSYIFNYSMNIYAAYISTNFSIRKWLDVTAGARYEYTDVKMLYGNTTVPSYSNLMPSLILSHQLNDNQSIKLAYARRLERPDRELNPFLNISDPNNITTGNPYLKPEIGNNFELGFSSGNFYIAAVERINQNDIKSYTSFYPSYQIGDSLYKNVSITNRMNIGEEYNIGLIVSGSIPLIKNMTLRENLMLFNKHVVNKVDGTKTDGFNWRLNMNLGYQISSNLVTEVFGEYRSPFNSIQGKAPQSLTYTLAVRKQFWNKKASIGLTATNPFNQYINQLTTITTADYTSTVIRKIPYRSFGLSFSYKFGKLQFKKETEHDNYLNNPPSM